jgi:CBS domain-containing protein
MTRNVFAIPARTSVKEAAQMLLARHYSGAPVIDATRNCVGVVSLRDITRYQQSRSNVRVYEHDFYASSRIDDAGDQEIDLVVERDPDENVEQIMTPIVLAVEEDAPIAEVVRLVVHHHVHRIFVMDEDRHLVGIVSTIDVLGGMLPFLEAAPAKSSDRAASVRKPARAKARKSRR